MLKNIFYISLVLAVLDLIVFFYYNSYAFEIRHQQILAGYNQILITSAIFIALFLWWIVYYILTKNFSNIWMPLILILIPIALFSFKGVTEKIYQTQRKNDELAWKTRVKNLGYTSQKLGVSFEYISESESDGAVSIKEEGSVIKIIREKDSTKEEGLKLFGKGSQISLKDYLTNKYKKDFPKCVFSESETAYVFDRQFPSSYSIVSMNDLEFGSGEGCPVIGIEKNMIRTARNNFFIMDKNKPTKYAYIFEAEYPIKAYLKEDKQSLNWFETIQFK